MSHATTTRQRSSRSIGTRSDPTVTEGLDERRLSAAEIRAAIEAIPPDGVKARTAGALRVEGRRHTIAEEKSAFEWGVAEENARQMEE